jgi:hypothetical protein
MVPPERQWPDSDRAKTVSAVAVAVASLETVMGIDEGGSCCNRLPHEMF